MVYRNESFVDIMEEREASADILTSTNEMIFGIKLRLFPPIKGNTRRHIH